MDPSAGNPSIKGYWRHRAQKKTPSSMPSVDAITEEYDFEAESLLADHMRLLRMTDADDSQLSSEMEEIRSTPLFSAAVAKLGKSRSGMTFPQFGLLAGRKRIVPQTHGSTPPKLHDPRIFLNVNAPWSAFICGSQGSGKSHSLSCMLENCLLPNSILGLLPNPLTALVFHYDSFTSTAGGQVSEAAYLCSSGLPVKVLVSPTNLAAMTILYTNIRGLPPGISPPTVQPFFLSQRYLNAERLMTLMAAGSSDGPMPLYMQTVLQVLRDMAKESQSKPGIDYTLFKHRILSKDLSAAQLAPLSLRLDLLESFIETDTKSQKYKKYNKDWTHTPGHLTIVDLSCPFVDSDTACGLFDMCLGVFLEQDMKIGRLVVLDEAHKVRNTKNPFHTHNPLNPLFIVYGSNLRSRPKTNRLPHRRHSSPTPSSMQNHNRDSGTNHFPPFTRSMQYHPRASLLVPGMDEGFKGAPCCCFFGDREGGGGGGGGRK